MTSTSLVLSWVPPPVENRNGDIQHYTIAITETETGERFNRTVSNYTSMLLTQLHPYYRYKCQVAAVTVEIGPFGVPIVIQTLQDGKIAHPQTSCIHPACTTNAFDTHHMHAHLYSAVYCTSESSWQANELHSNHSVMGTPTNWRPEWNYNCLFRTAYRTGKWNYIQQNFQLSQSDSTISSSLLQLSVDSCCYDDCTWSKLYSIYCPDK